MLRPTRVLAATTVAALLPAAAFSADPFYLNLLRQGEVELQAQGAGEAVDTLRIACFGLLDEPPVLAQCLATLGLAQDRSDDDAGFRSTFERLVTVEERFGGYSASQLSAETRGEFEAALLRRMPESALLRVPVFAELVPSDLDRVAGLPLAERRRELQRLIDSEPKRVTWRLMLGDLELEAGRERRAARHFEEALELDPGDRMAHLRLASLATAERSWQTAADHLAASGAAATDPQVAAQLLRALTAAGRPGDALTAADALPVEVLEAPEVEAALESARLALPSPSPAQPTSDAEGSLTVTTIEDPDDPWVIAGDPPPIPDADTDNGHAASAGSVPGDEVALGGDATPPETSPDSRDLQSGEVDDGQTEAPPATAWQEPRSTAIDPATPAADEASSPAGSRNVASDQNPAPPPPTPSDRTSPAADEAAPPAGSPNVVSDQNPRLQSPTASVSGNAQLLDIRVQPGEGRTVVTVTTDTPLSASRVRHSRLTDPPRHLIRIEGVTASRVPYQLDVGDGRVVAVRSAVHPELDPPEVHIVIDKTSERVNVSSVRVAGRVLLIEVS